MSSVRIGQASDLLKDIVGSSSYTNVGVLVDENTAINCLPLVDYDFDKVIRINSGEQFKTIETCKTIWEELTEAEFDRHSLLVNLGGGVIGDMGGFCAATFKRGIDFINIPTTLLSQVDAGIGGKLGIDFLGFKNHIGLFREPKSVLIDTSFLKTLPKRELRSGFAEVIKHYLISDEKGFDNLVHKQWNDQDWDQVVSHSINVKSGIVMQDPQEHGVRKILNFGHTIGHALETFYLRSETPLLHGEAVAMGMVAEAHVSWQKGMIGADIVEYIRDYVHDIFSSREMDKDEYSRILELVSHDKKNLGGDVQCVLLKSIGAPVWDQSVSSKEIVKSLDYLNQM